MKKMLLSLGLVVIAAALTGVASAAPVPQSPAEAALAAALGVADCAQTEATAEAVPTAAPEPQAVVCCTAEDRAACNADCAPLAGHTICIHGCECFCY